MRKQKGASCHCQAHRAHNKRDYSSPLHFSNKVCCKEVTAVCYTSVTKCAAKRLQQYATLPWQSMLQRDYSSMLHFRDKVCCKAVTGVHKQFKTAAQRWQQYENTILHFTESFVQRCYGSLLHFSDNVCCKAVTTVGKQVKLLQYENTVMHFTDSLEQRDNSSDLLDFFRDFPASTSESALSLQHQHSVLTPDCSPYRSHGGPSPQGN